MSEERRIVELGVGDVDLVAGLWIEMVVHHQAVIDGRWPGRDPEVAWRMRRGQYVGWLEAGEGRLFLVPGEGVGTLLIEHCRALLRAEGIGFWNVTAVAANSDAVRLYEREGFETVSHNLLAPIE